MKIPRFCNMSDMAQGLAFIVIGSLILLNTLNIRVMNILLFVVSICMIAYGLIATGWFDKISAMIRKKSK